MIRDAEGRAVRLPLPEIAQESGVGESGEVKSIKTGLVTALLVLSWSPGFAQDLSTHFAGISGTVLLNGNTGTFIRHDPERAAQRFAPCSTFKIPHTALLLESGTAPDPEFLVKYDPALKQQGVWARDHTLRSAYRFSTVWYYVVLARRAGLPVEGRFLKQFAYGNSPSPGASMVPKGRSGLTASAHLR